MRHDRLNHAWQGTMQQNLTDFFKRQHHTADPEICQIILRDLPKKEHQPHRPAVLELFENGGSLSEPVTPTNAPVPSTSRGPASPGSIGKLIQKYL